MMKKRRLEPVWSPRLILIGFGSVLIFVGREMIRQGYLWSGAYDVRRNWYQSPADFVAFGLLIILIGVIPWKLVSRLLERFMPEPKERKP